MKYKIDYTYINESIDNDKDALKEILELFICETPMATKTISEALAKKDWDRLKKSVHKMKSSLGMLGLSKLTSICSSVENKIGQSTNYEDIPTLINALISELQLLIVQLQKDLNEIK